MHSRYACKNKLSRYFVHKLSSHGINAAIFQIFKSKFTVPANYLRDYFKKISKNYKKKKICHLEEKKIMSNLPASIADGGR